MGDSRISRSGGTGEGGRGSKRQEILVSQLEMIPRASQYPHLLVLLP